MDSTVILKKHPRPPKLVCFFQGRVTEFPLKNRQVLGRITSKSTPDIGLHSGVVSRNHGMFSTTDHVALYRDSGSTNGTIYNNRYLDPSETVQLTGGDVLRIHGRNDEQKQLDVTMVYMDSYPNRTVWREQPLSSDIAEIAVGRAEKLALSDESVSRRHASFFLASKGWAIIDHNSKNGVFVNNRRITRPVYLQPLDVVQIASYLFFYTGSSLLYQCDSASSPVPSRPVPGVSSASRTPGAAPAPDRGRARRSVLSISIEERNVWHRMRKKTLLKDISMDIPAGSMVLILGGSGAGKTTFMNAVMGYERAEGRIRYDSTDIYAEYEKMKYEIGYVPQQDLLRMNDTVQSTLDNAARMRLSAGLSDAEYQAAVDRTCNLLGLDRERNSLVGKLSGGQRKRLSIGVEYIGNPSLFFLDEPDSGLDGTMARSLMENLRAIADQGKIVLVISHSPDRAFELFDKVIVLAKGSDDCGHLVFYGSPKEGCAFFEVDSLEHIVKRINRPDEGGDGLADHFINKYNRGGRR